MVEEGEMEDEMEDERVEEVEDERVEEVEAVATISKVGIISAEEVYGAERTLERRRARSQQKES